jgi:hypothetical protein
MMKLMPYYKKNGTSRIDLRPVPTTGYDLPYLANWRSWRSNQNSDLLIQIDNNSSLLKIGTTEAFEAIGEFLKRKAKKDTEGM